MLPLLNFAQKIPNAVDYCDLMLRRNSIEVNCFILEFSDKPGIGERVVEWDWEMRWMSR